MGECCNIREQFAKWNGGGLELGVLQKSARVT